MKRLFHSILISAAFVLATATSRAQDGPAETARAFIRQGDYSNAILVLRRALESGAGNPELRKDLAYAYYLQRDYPNALETASAIAESPAADVRIYQILGMVYKAIEDPKEAERAYRAGIRKFPESGALYAEYGESLWNGKHYKAAGRQWEKGIQIDPGYSGNYYHAARYYYMSGDVIWAAIYGEIFVNLESYSRRTPEIKTVLLESYKRLLSVADLSKVDTNNEFVKNFLDALSSHSRVIAGGVTPDGMSALRTRFVLDWFDKHATKFPFRLFEYHQQLARAGLFDAYNQWIFGAAGNLAQFEQWTVTHAAQYERFVNFQRNRVMKIPAGQYYQQIK